MDERHASAVSAGEGGVEVQGAALLLRSLVAVASESQTEVSPELEPQPTATAIEATASRTRRMEILLRPAPGSRTDAIAVPHPNRRELLACPEDGSHAVRFRRA